MIYRINTPYNYQHRNLKSSFVGVLDVVEVDTSLNESMFDSTSNSRESTSKSQYLNNAEPVNVFGPGILMTEFDPIHNKWLKSQAQAQSQQSESSKGSVADTSAHVSQVNSNSENVS